MKPTEEQVADALKLCRGVLRSNFIPIKPGTFMMGSPSDELGRFSDETQHSVTLTKAFEIGETPVTQAQWASVNPGEYDVALSDHPMTNISWDDCQAFIAKLNVAKDGYAYRLPTEAEWEYCARAGTKGPYWFLASKIDAHAWYCGNSGGKNHPVGAKGHANQWGLSDMLGNVWEWTEDWYEKYPSGAVTDPTGPDTGLRRVIRGGSWGLDARILRSAYRRRGDLPGYRNPNVGLRLVRSPVAIGPLDARPCVSESRAKPRRVTVEESLERMAAAQERSAAALERISFFLGRSGNR